MVFVDSWFSYLLLGVFYLEAMRSIGAANFKIDPYPFLAYIFIFIIRYLFCSLNTFFVMAHTEACENQARPRRCNRLRTPKATAHALRREGRDQA